MDVAKLHSPGGNKKDEEEVVLPGFRFHPTDEEIVGFYLLRKVEKKPLRIELIKQVDIYKYDPWDLPRMNLLGDKEWYFFCLRERKYKNSVRPNRVTKSGFWKATGIDKSIYCVKESHECIGLKKSLVYYRGSAGKGTKTDWMMHEFRLPSTPDAHATNDFHEAEVWTLCRIFKRVPSYKKYTPKLKDSEAALVNKLPNQADSNTCCSFGSQNLDMQQFDRKPVFGQVEENNKHFFLSQFGSMANQYPSTVSTPSSWNPNVANENWDDLTSVFQLVDDSDDPSIDYI